MKTQEGREHWKTENQEEERKILRRIQNGPEGENVCVYLGLLLLSEPARALENASGFPALLSKFLWASTNHLSPIPALLIPSCSGFVTSLRAPFCLQVSFHHQTSCRC